MKPYYSDDHVTLYHGDCLDILPGLEFDVIVTDPPYGINLDTDYSRPSKNSRTYRPIEGDEVPFDPSPWLLLQLPLVLFGANHFAQSLPVSRGWICWDKVTRNDITAGQISDGELAWTNFLPRLRIYRHMWNGAFRDSERGTHYHPTQKPVRLMAWVTGLCPPGVILDPYAGSGPTLRAAKDLGRKAIGIEIDERYCEIAARRMGQEVLAL